MLSMPNGHPENTKVKFTELMQKDKVNPNGSFSSEAFFLKAIENHAAVILLIDPDTGGIVYANAASTGFYGWTVERISESQIREIDAPSWTRGDSWLKDLVSDGQGRFLTMHRRIDGTLRHVEVSFGTTTLNGKTHLFFIVQDNSERQHFEVLTEFRHRLLEIADNASTEELLTFTLDEAERLTGSTIGFFNFISDNQSVLRYACSTNSQTDNCGHAPHPTVIDFGVSADVIHKKSAVIHNDHATLRHCNCKFVNHSETRRELIVPIIRNGKVTATLEIGNKPVDYDENDIRLVSILAGVAWDIIAKKFAEESEHKMQAALQHTQKMELIGRLAGGIAHDINNVLAAILGHSEIVIDRMSPENPLTENLQNIQNSATRAANLIQQLLAFARRQTIQPKVVLLDAVLGEQIPMLRVVVGEQARFEWQSGTHDARIFIDPSQLEQLMTNLCTNARDAIDHQGSVTIETSIVRVEPSDCYAGHPCQTPGNFAMISVIDTGCGIDKNVFPHIFEPFFTTKSVGKGTGLGLSTVYGIAKQNKGWLDCQSTPVKGTRFTVYLPLFDSPVEQSKTQLPKNSAQHDERKTVLLVDDNQAIVQVIKSVLVKNGYHVLTATSPNEAIGMVTDSKERIDLLLTDMVMPEMNGKELSIKILSLYPQVKTLFMSGYTLDMTALKGVSEDETQFIRKPFRISELTKKINTILA
jgi:PAS domain S-box-containing protein